jgi:hypothetical protein
MPDGYEFDQEDDAGIFLSDDGDGPKGAAKDPDAAADIMAEEFIPGIAFEMGPDGIPVPEVRDVGILDPPPAVTPHNLICLAGECRHYSENVRYFAPSIDEGADPHVEINRWCGRLRTWAEQTSLKELEVFGCTEYEPTTTAHNDEEVAEALVQNIRELHHMRARAKEVDLSYGICSVGPCKDFVELVCRKPVDRPDPSARVSQRFCTRLSGLGRLYDLREKPVLGCTAWTPLGTGDLVRRGAEANQLVIDKYREALAKRSNNEDEEKDHG